MLKHIIIRTAFIGGGVCIGGYAYLNYCHKKYSIDINHKYNIQSKLLNREQMIQQMKNNIYELIIIGGGATGSGVALDASTRGIKCCLLEGEDFSGGTSSKSTKLLHGGIRYLEDAFKTFNFSKLSLVWESLEERAHAINSCEYMCRSVPIILPVYNIFNIPYFLMGVKVYDFIAKLVCSFQSGVPDCYYLSRSNTIQKCPLINADKLKGGIVYYDGEHNDSRMNLNILFTSALDKYVDSNHNAAHIANYCKVINFLKDPQTQNIIGVKVLDRINNEQFDIYGKVIVNCTGPFTDEIRKLVDPNCTPYIQTSAGSHIVLPGYYTQNQHGLIIPETSDKRVLFMLPWENSTIVGTTEERCNVTDVPKPQKKEINFIIDEVAKYVNVDPQQIKDDIKSEWCGLRPLVAIKSIKELNEKEESTSKWSRSHQIILEQNGIVSVMGGKWTTYRKMAQDTLDEILKVYKNKISSKINCRTKNLKLMGSFDETGIYSPQDIRVGTGKLPLEIMKKYKNLKYEDAAYLVRNYGFNANKILHLGETNHSNNKIHPNHSILKSEIIYVIRHEMARRVSDVIGRRTRIAFEDVNAAKEIVPSVIDIMAKELNWGSKEIQEAKIEATNYLNTFVAA